MSAASGRWADLLPRVLSGALLAGLGIAAVWAGGLIFHIFVALVAGMITWELARMLGAGQAAIWIALGAGLALLAAFEIPGRLGVPLVLVPVLLGAMRTGEQRWLFSLYALAVQIAGYGLVHLRDDFGFIWMVWLALVVIATDIGGYFAGRVIGGPKILPRISPKKTWSGTISGWLASAAVSILFLASIGAGWSLVGYGVAISMASQLGDVAESALKRKVGVKDSSALIPGHGGLLDRFDSMLGASLFVLFLELTVNFPPVTGG